MAEFESVEALHGSNIYPECCSMKVEFCKKERLTVKRNDNISWDFTIKISEGTSRGCSSWAGPSGLPTPTRSCW